jgi:hypothetical protein
MSALASRLKSGKGLPSRPAQNASRDSVTFDDRWFTLLKGVLLRDMRRC